VGTIVTLHRHRHRAARGAAKRTVAGAAKATDLGKRKAHAAQAVVEAAVAAAVVVAEAAVGEAEEEEGVVEVEAAVVVATAQADRTDRMRLTTVQANRCMFSSRPGMSGRACRYSGRLHAGALSSTWCSAINRTAGKLSPAC